MRRTEQIDFSALEKNYHQRNAMKLGALLLLLMGSMHGVFTQVPTTAFTERTAVEEDLGSGLLEVEQEDELGDTYWSGTAPLCFGGCKGRHRELKRDNCGDSNCCWVGYKTLCRVNCGKPDVDFNGMVYGSDWWVGSVVRYDCRPGFVLVGDPARACQSNGKWTPKPSCLRVCHRGRVEINEKDIDGTCSSTCPDAKSYAVPLNHECSRVENCRTKESGWKRWFTRCNFCDCDCFTPCASTG
ncbi:hypothetical protein R3I93_003067 [Phoxinus phoxinus]|uniref:Sushi domain-containing protein n=2 Tax=Phoxinus phoxinus TaxID=58324 RepID=A0AAN9DG79_9TELE